MIKLIPNVILAVQMDALAEAIDGKVRLTNQYLLHDNTFFMLGEPFSLAFDLINKKISKCTPRSEVKESFEDAIELKPQSLPSAMINMIGNAFSQWLGISPYDNAGVYYQLNMEGNRQLEHHNLIMNLSDDSLKITHYGEEISYEATLKYLLTYGMVDDIFS